MKIGPGAGAPIICSQDLEDIYKRRKEAASSAVDVDDAVLGPCIVFFTKSAMIDGKARGNYEERGINRAFCVDF